MGIGNRRRHSNRRAIVTGLILFLAVWAMFVVWIMTVSTPNEAKTKQKSGPREVHMEQIYNFDVADKRLLVGYSKDVFVATVKRRVSNKPAVTTIPGGDQHPRTQYEATVSRTMKGDLAPGESVTINQAGGRGERTGVIYVVQGVAGRGIEATDTPLEPGEEYVFSTTPDPDTGWLTLSAQPWGDVPTQRQRRSLIEEFERAVRTQADPYEYMEESR